MKQLEKTKTIWVVLILSAAFCCMGNAADSDERQRSTEMAFAAVHPAIRFNLFPPLALSHAIAAQSSPQNDDACCGRSPDSLSSEQEPNDPAPSPKPVISEAGAAVEQRSQGQRPASFLIESFDGLGAGFEGPNGTATFKNPSDNSLAVGPNHIVQIVNTRIAVYTKKGAHYDKTGKV